VLTLADAAYPAALLQIEDPPILLYLLGSGLFEKEAGFDQSQRPQAAPETIAKKRPVFDFQRSLGMVGSRNPTAQGKDNAKAFARALAQVGVTVVSGMALGIDAAAHAGALDGANDALAAHPDGMPAGLPTIAVVGTGLDRVYPRRNLSLAHRIAAQGLILSEYPVGTPPLAENFPRRNRLIAALSRGTLVVEAALASGSLITARLASEQGREVFAIPGSIHSGMSKGCHALIRQGAKLVEEVQDILEELPGLAVGIAPSVLSASVAGQTNPDQADLAGQAELQCVLTALGHDPAHLDKLLARTGLPTPKLLALLMQLELAGQVARLPGGLYQRVAVA
jgi:DNA processing protein